jgi:hypothetical protein
VRRRRIHFLRKDPRDGPTARALVLPRFLPRQELVGDDAPRELIDARVERIAAQLFGRHVERRADDLSFLGDGVARAFAAAPNDLSRDAEIEHFDDAITAHHDVLGLDVAMHEAAGVRRRERARDVAEPSQSHRHAHRRIADERAQRAPRDELHRDERVPLVLAHVEHGHGVGVVQRRRRARLAHETRRALRSLDALDAKDLERDQAIELLVVRSVHAAHAAFAHARFDHVAVVEDVSQRERHELDPSRAEPRC